MPKIILFDLYDTILKDISFDFSLGLKYLHDNFFTSACSFKELTEYAETFLPLYEKRKSDCTEICLIKDEIPLFFEKFNVAKPESFSGERLKSAAEIAPLILTSVSCETDLLEYPLTRAELQSSEVETSCGCNFKEEFSEIEYAVMNAIQKETFTNEVRDTLQELHKIGVEMYILSNSIFTGKAAERLLDDFGILHFFKKIFSSADYKIRKPSAKFFQIAIDEILSALTSATKDDILYVGNDYEPDVIGGTGVGLKTVWYNVAHLENRKNLLIEEIDDFRKIVEIVKRKEFL